MFQASVGSTLFITPMTLIQWSGDWFSIYSAIIEKHAPMRKMRISDKNSPCVNNKLKSLMKSRDKLKKYAVKHKSEAMMGCYKIARSKQWRSQRSCCSC